MATGHSLPTVQVPNITHSSLQKSGCHTLESGPVKPAVLRDLGSTAELTCAAAHNAIAALFKALRMLYCVRLFSS